MRNPSRWILAAGAAALLGACASTPTPQLDAGFGSAVRAARAAQTLNPEASRNTDPVAGIDAGAGKSAHDRYEDSFKAPPPTFSVINIGGGISGGGGGQ